MKKYVNDTLIFTMKDTTKALDALSRFLSNLGNNIDFPADLSSYDDMAR